MCRSNISLYITRQFEKHSSCLGSPDYGRSTANCFPPRWLGIINWRVLEGRIELPTIPARTNAVQNLPFRPEWWQWLEHQEVMWSFCVFPTRCANVGGGFVNARQWRRGDTKVGYLVVISSLFLRVRPVCKLFCQFTCCLWLSSVNRAAFPQHLFFNYWTKGHN